MKEKTKPNEAKVRMQKGKWENEKMKMTTTNQSHRIQEDVHSSSM
jgi:hypothetical protein